MDSRSGRKLREGLTSLLYEYSHTVNEGYKLGPFCQILENSCWEEENLRDHLTQLDHFIENEIEIHPHCPMKGEDLPMSWGLLVKEPRSGSEFQPSHPVGILLCRADPFH